MAKDRNAAQRRKIKMQDNARASYRHPLTCNVEKGCTTEFHVAAPGYPSRRACLEHRSLLIKPTTEEEATVKSMIQHLTGMAALA